MPRFPKLNIRQAGKSILLVLGLLAGLNLAFYLVFVQPERRGYRALEGQAEFKALSELRERVERHEIYLDAVRQAETDLRRLRDDVLSTRDARLVDVQAELAELCRQFGIDLEQVSYDSLLIPESELDRLAINVPLQGNYNSLRNFLQAVEKSEKFLLVEKVGLSRGGPSGKSLSLSISMATYFIAPEHLLDRRGRRGRS